jgi:hypothetical protein
MRQPLLAMAMLASACTTNAAPPPAGPCDRGVTPAASGDSPDSAEIWRRLTSRLVGDWEAPVETGVVRVSYRLASSGSVLVETFRTPSGKETLTVYHRDGARMLLTHYCAQENQPRLRAIALDDRDVRFELVDVTDLDAGESVMRALVVSFRDDGFDQTTTYRDAEGRDETETLRFVPAAM